MWPPIAANRHLERIEPIAGTPFGVAYPSVTATVSGIAVGSMVAGIGSILVSLLVYAFGLAGAGSGWGPLVAGAFAILAGLAGLAALATGLVAMRQIRRTPESRGRELAITGVVCGGSGVALTLLGFLLVVALAGHG